MTAPISIALLADDYGIAPGVSQGIRELLQSGRLSGTSCLVLSPHWKAEAPVLRDLDAWADIGLHLAFTDFAPLGALPGLAPGGKLPGLGKLIVSAYLGLLLSYHLEVASGPSIILVAVPLIPTTPA